LLGLSRSSQNSIAGVTTLKGFSGSSGTPVIACDKRKAFAQGSESDEAIQSLYEAPTGLLRGACHRARIRATRWLAMTNEHLCFAIPDVIWANLALGNGREMANIAVPYRNPAKHLADEPDLF